MKKADTFVEHCSYDLKIHLEKGTMSFIRIIYFLSLFELETFKNSLMKMSLWVSSNQLISLMELLSSLLRIKMVLSNSAWISMDLTKSLEKTNIYYSFLISLIPSREI